MFRQCRSAGIKRCFKKSGWLKNPTDLDHIKVAIQGYNYGMDRWISWIKKHGGKYTLALSKEYSATMMPAGAKGTPNHAEKVMKYYSIATGDSSGQRFPCWKEILV